MAKVTVHTLLEKKQSGEKITSLTAYDATFARLLASQGVEVILVGDSLGNVVQGLHTTVPVTVDDICYHTRCVARGAGDSMVMSDLPFASCATEELALSNATRLMQAGAEVVKIEGGAWLAPVITRLRQQGIPVCVHLGLTPQFVNLFGGNKVQGRDKDQADTMATAAKTLEEAGAAMLLLECVPAALAEEITRWSGIPVIGIGAGAATDGQILVTYDMLGMSKGNPLKFVRNFMEKGDASLQEAVARYVASVGDGSFPGTEHTFD